MRLHLRANGGGRVHGAAVGVNGEKWSMLFPKGEWHGASLEPIGGSIVLTEQVLTEMVANWKAQGSPALPVYWHHPPPIDEVPPEKRKDVFRAAGHIEGLRVTAEGLEARIAWSVEGQAALDRDEYRFISPEWAPAHIDRHTGDVKGWAVTGAGLTDSPFFNEMPRVAAATQHQRGPAPQEKHVDKKMICAAIGLDEGSDDAVVMAALKDLFKKSKASLEVDAKLTATATEAKTLKASLDETVAANAKLAARITEIETERASLAANTLADRLVSERRIVAAQRESVTGYAKTMGLKAAEEFFGKLPQGNLTAPGEVGHAQGGKDEPVVDMKALTAQYTAEVDKKIAAGMKTGEASRAVRAMPEFAALKAGTKMNAAWDSTGN